MWATGYAVTGTKDSPPADSTPHLFYHRLVTKEDAINSTASLLMEPPQNLYSLYGGLEHRVLSIPGLNKLIGGAYIPISRYNLTEVIMPIVFFTYAYVYANHFSALSTDEYGRDRAGIAAEVLPSISTAMVMRDLGFSALHPQWRPARIADHLLLMGGERGMDREAVIGYLSAASRQAIYLCIHYDIAQTADLYLQKGPARRFAPKIDEGEVRRFLSTLERKLKADTDDTYAVKFLRNMTEGKIHGPKTGLASAAKP